MGMDVSSNSIHCCEGGGGWDVVTAVVVIPEKKNNQMIRKPLAPLAPLNVFLTNVLPSTIRRLHVAKASLNEEAGAAQARKMAASQVIFLWLCHQLLFAWLARMTLW